MQCKLISGLGRFAGLLAVGLIAHPAVAVEILPTGYSVHQATDVGTYAYHDETGQQLIDGSYGVAPWFADLGHGFAYEWLGWYADNPVTIDFTFAGAQPIDEIRVGTVQDNLTDVVVPQVRAYVPDGLGGWNLVASLLTPESSANDNQYFTLVLDQLGLLTAQVRVELSFAHDGPWTFTDEIDFYSSSTAVPEAGSTAALGVLALGTLATARRRRVSR